VVSELLIWAITQTILTPFILRWIREWQEADDHRMRPTPLLVGLVKTAVIGTLVFEWVGVVLELVL
jgi:hypothetical protein